MINIVINNLPEKVSREQLEEYSWKLGVLLNPLAEKEKQLFLEYILDKYIEIDAKCNILNGMVTFFDLFSPDYKLKFIKLLIALADCHRCTYCCKTPQGIMKILHRISSYVDEQGREAIAEFTKRNEKTQEKNNLPPKVTSTAYEIALVVPDHLSATSFLQPPIGMLMAAARLRAKGYKVKFIDNRVKKLTIEDLALEVAGSELIIVTTTPYDHIQNYFLDIRLKYTFKTINVIKQHNLDAKVIVVGAHGTVRPDIVFKESLADLILKWDFDYTIVDLIETISRKGDLQTLENVCTRDSIHELVSSQKPNIQATSLQLNDGILPAYDLIDFNDYYGDIYINNELHRKYNWSILLASRGCRNKCTFCFNFWGNQTIYREPLHVVNEMEYLQEVRNVQDVFFIDFNFTQDQEWVSEFCRLIVQKKIKINWSAQTRCDDVSYELMKEMRQANCRALWFGVESYNTCIIQNVHKYSDPEVAVRAINDCKRAGIMPHQFVMIGLPGETRETINNTIKFIHSLKIPFTESILIATPRFGSSYYEMAKAQYNSLGDDFYSLNYVRGLVNNSLTPKDILETLDIFEARDFIYKSTPPLLTP